MASKNKKKNNKNLGILILLLFLIILVILMFNNKKNNTLNGELSDTEIEQEENNIIIKNLQSMEERDRMEYYFGEFLDFIEKEDYEKAYDLLYPEFKENYFPTLKSFEEYAKEKFSDMNNIEHDNIERNGDMYILWIYISDAINGKPGENEEMKVVIQENDYNDFVMSFSVI